ncbi:sigma-70 family RNA polymerase sigma factor [Sphaerisporangium fuscum]|uniref:sigma-70 family RNA polymerase sigma factor n=1 Tax=Sphaerisporangium fuscum TaxID=2835868 RepID=UPI002029A8FF|nr:sigma-70 family RNA polymerase sigma factor [Sphaerisporangium fuscum]
MPRVTGRPGRASLYCSAACRQKAYRSRQATGGDGVHELIDDIRRRAQALAPELPEPFYADVTALSSSVGRLRRIATIAWEATRAGETVTPARVTPSPDEAGETVAPSPEETTDIVTAENVTESADVLDAVRSGDEWTFAGLVEPHRRELQVHCYRMVGSFDDAEDLVQEVLLRAWRRRDGFQGRSTLRAWLYGIATNACLDFLRRNTRRPQPYGPSPVPPTAGVEAPPMLAWLQPFPDRLLDEIPSAELGPDAAAVSRETMELVFLAAIQHLPPRQRAVLVMRDVLGWPAADTAQMLEMSVASVNSALQRARPAMREHLPGRRPDWTRRNGLTREEEDILRRYVDAAVRGDTSAMVDMLSEDARITMPPNPLWFGGRDAIMSFMEPTFDPASPRYFGRWRHLPTRANRQPALGGYVQRPGTAVYRAQVLDVLRVEDGRIVEITSFEPHLFPAFGLPLTLRPGSDDFPAWPAS